MHWRDMQIEKPEHEQKILLKCKYGIIEVYWNSEEEHGDFYISHDMQAYGRYWIPLSEMPPTP